MIIQDMKYVEAHHYIYCDVSAKSLNLSFLSAYLDSLGTNFTGGANFATAASTIRLPARIIPANNGFSPFFFLVQHNQFVQLKARSCKDINQQDHDTCHKIIR